MMFTLTLLYLEFQANLNIGVNERFLILKLAKFNWNVFRPLTLFFSLSISLSVCLSSQRNANAPSVSSLIGTTSHPTYKTMDLVENLPDYFRCFLKKLYRFAVGTVPRVMDHRRSFTTKNVNQTSCE